MNLANCSELPRQPLTGTWYRAIQPQYWQRLNQVAYTRRIPSRFNAGTNQYAILYLAETPLVAQYEIQALLGTLTASGGPVANPRQTWVMLNITVQLHTIVDLTQALALHLLETNTQELTGVWWGYPRSGPLALGAPPAGTVPTQDLGAALFAQPDVEGFLTISSRLPYFHLLVVFLDKLQSGSQVTYHNPATGETLTFPPSA